ncbi:DNA polymerase III subunit delta [Aureispira anguillae]|uniref:DNA polymerase III subunit delta n=1 Tax=Aureispira anguillae TaxID=2864201 RepID=A0A915YBG2_9BACT|nr:DNA polymerase III subunit delta [Aureispira anguillae]BDS09958.1 DNA polymerase III subunit delta [Aureispira anguillae]
MAKAKSLSYKQVLNSLQKKEYFPIYLLHGEESFYIDELTKYIEENVLDETAKAFNQTVLYGKEIDYKTVLDSARRYPVMSDKQVVIIKEVQELKTLDKLEAYFQNPLDSTILVLAHKHKKLDKRKKYAKALTGSKKVCVFESTRLYDNQVPNWINNYLKDKNISIKPAATNLLAEYLGTNLSKISNELDKLTINLPAGAAIDKHIIQKNIGISKDFNVFELQQALGRRDKFKSFLIVKYFIANPKNHPLPMITATLYNFFSKVYVCQSMLRASDVEIAAAIGANKFFVKDYKLAAKHYTRPQLESVIAVLKEYDLRSKGVHNASIPHGELLREMIVKILG